MAVWLSLLLCMVGLIGAAISWRIYQVGKQRMIAGMGVMLALLAILALSNLALTLILVTSIR